MIDLKIYDNPGSELRYKVLVNDKIFIELPEKPYHPLNVSLWKVYNDASEFLKQEDKGNEIKYFVVDDILQAVGDVMEALKNGNK